MSLFTNYKPYVRWWWFANKIYEKDIKTQLDWIKNNGFGGVEIAWIYATNYENHLVAPKFLSKKWKALVNYATKYAHSINLQCDFTFGTCWPFGGSMITEKYCARNFEGLSKDRVNGSWELEPGRILNHLERGALQYYSNIMGQGLKESIKINHCCLFCDSWEIDINNIWTDNFEMKFQNYYGYDITPFMTNINTEVNVRYDYRKLIADYIINEFYRPLTDICHKLGALSRVQCHGSLTDLLEAYSTIDIPESESLLFDPPFSQIAASAAALTNKIRVSAETFTCLYGFKPALYMQQEYIGDLKLLADSLFANGINFIIWHGMPYFNELFYATIYVGPNSSLSPYFNDFNNYLTQVSHLMHQGTTYSKAAVYLPLEDNWMKNIYPDNLRRPGGIHYFDLRHLTFPTEVKDYRPLWITYPFLAKSKVKNSKLYCGTCKFKFLYIDVDWLDIQSLIELLRIATEGVLICLKRLPKQPGYVKYKEYQIYLNKLLSLTNVKSNLHDLTFGKPLLKSDLNIDYWCRQLDDNLIIFLAHPKSTSVIYPMIYQQSDCTNNILVNLEIYKFHKIFKIPCTFEPHQSLIIKLNQSGLITFEDIKFQF